MVGQFFVDPPFIGVINFLLKSVAEQINSHLVYYRMLLPSQSEMNILDSAGLRTKFFIIDTMNGFIKSSSTKKTRSKK